MLMGELNQDWGSPWRALQALLANQAGVALARENHRPDANDDRAIEASSIKRARQRQFSNRPTRQ